MEQLGKKAGENVEVACPGCGMTRAEWPDEGVVVNGTSYCCMACAHGLGCTCERKRKKTKTNKPRK